MLDGVVDPRFAVHAHHAEVQRVRGGKAAEAEQREGDGNFGALGQCAHLLHGAGFGDAVAGENDGALGIADELGGLLEAAVCDVKHGVRAIRARLGGGEVENGRALLRVLGDVNEHWARTTGACDLKCMANCAGDVFSAADEEVVLGYRQSDAGNVDFLKCVRAEQLGGHVAGDADDGNRVEHSRGDAGNEVGGAGTAGGDGHAYLARGARVAVGHVGRALLMAHQHVTNHGKLAQRIVGGQNGAAGIAKDICNSLADQRGPDDFRAGEAGGGGEMRAVDGFHGRSSIAASF